MRRINRPKESPWFLKSDRVRYERNQMLTYLRREPGDRRQRRDPLNDDIFFDSELRDSLSFVFSEKCAFCETPVGRDGGVVHLRPLRFAAENEGLDKSYYLWIAFEWRNLFYGCRQCIKAKGDRFPVAGPRASFLATFDDIVENEDALLIDPTAEDPFKSLRFLCDGSVVPLSPKGTESIAVFDLNRGELVQERSRLVEQMFALLGDRGSGALGRLLSIGDAHSGALINILKRVATAWLAADRPIKGNGDLFVNRFFNQWMNASDAQLGQLSSAVRQVELADAEARNQPHMMPIYSLVDRAKDEFWIANGEIARIDISNFKAIDRLCIEMPPARSSRSGAPALMILGENSTGKSSALAAIALALIGRREAAKLKKFMPALVHSTGVDRFDQLDSPPVEVRVDFHFASEQSSFLFDVTQQFILGDEVPPMLVLGYGARRFFDTKKRQRPSGGAARVRTLFDPLATIPYPADWLRAQTGSRFDTVAAALRVVLALNEGDELIDEPDFLAVRANGRVTPIDALSEGYRSVFVMTVDIIRELLEHWDNLEQAQAVVLIDELETHLHPRWKMQVMTSLRRVLPRVQFIVTTHDPLCLRGMDDGEVVVLQRDGRSCVRQIEDLPTVSGMSAEQLLTSDYFGLASTADPGTELALARLAGDVVRRNTSGEHEVAPSDAAMDLVSRLVVGDSQSQQIVQEAMVKYLEAREQRNGAPIAALRAEAVSAVIEALKAD
jgi:hypothetical protein